MQKEMNRLLRCKGRRNRWQTALAGRRRPTAPGRGHGDELEAAADTAPMDETLMAHPAYSPSTRTDPPPTPTG